MFEIKILNGQPAACKSIELLATLLYIDKGFDTTLVPFIYLFKKRSNNHKFNDHEVMIVGFESYDLKVHLRSLGQLTKSQLIALQVTDRRLEFTLTILLWPMMIEVTIIDDDLLSRSSFFILDPRYYH